MAITKVAPSLIAVANNVTSNVFGSANTIPSLTFDGSGVITSASNTAIQINTADIVNGAITTDKIATGAVVTADIADANVTTAKIADSSITTSKIADGNVTNAKIDTVANTKITGVMTASQLANTAVTAGVYGGSSNSALITVDAQGRITSASNVAAAGAQVQTELFTAPGTWTNPGTVTQVRVAVIGGGGGSGIGANPGTGGSGGTSSFGPAVSATGGGGGRGTPQIIGTPGTGTVSVGTTLRNTSVASSPGESYVNHYLTTGVTSTAFSAVTFSTTGIFEAGRSGFNAGPLACHGGAGGFASAIVPVSAPVTITVGEGGAGVPGPSGRGGIGGAVVVEFVG